MTAPALRTYANAGTEVDGDNFNTFEQTCNLFNDLRAFTGTTGMQVFTRGRTSVNDGYGGEFYWDGTSAGTDDNLNIVAPTGATIGRWLRASTTTGQFAGLTADQTGGDVADSLPFLDASESGAVNTVLVSNFMKNALTTMTAKATPVGADTVAIGDSAASGAIKSATITNILAAAAAATWPKGSLFGLGLSRLSTTTYGVATGQAANEDSGTQYNMTLSSAFTKSLSAFVAGTGNGSLDTGAVGATTWYHVHLIRKDSDSSIDVLLSLSATGPTMPAGYTARRRIGSIKTDGSSQIIAFSQDGNQFLWDVATVDIDATNPGTAAVTRTLNAPSGVKVVAIIGVGGFSNLNNFSINISSLDVSDQAAQVVGTAALTLIQSASGEGPVGTWMFVENRVRTNTSSQVRSRISASGASDRLGIITRGWDDRRGAEAW